MRKNTKKGMKLVAAVSMALLGMSYGMMGHVEAYGTAEQPGRYDAYTGQGDSGDIYIAKYSEKNDDIEGAVSFDVGAMSVTGHPSADAKGGSATSDPQAGSKAGSVYAWGLDAAAKGVSDATITIGDKKKETAITGGKDSTDPAEEAAASDKDGAKGEDKNATAVAAGADGKSSTTADERNGKSSTATVENGGNGSAGAKGAAGGDAAGYGILMGEGSGNTITAIHTAGAENKFIVTGGDGGIGGNGGQGGIGQTGGKGGNGAAGISGTTTGEAGGDGGNGGAGSQGGTGGAGANGADGNNGGKATVQYMNVENNTGLTIDLGESAQTTIEAKGGAGGVGGDGGAGGQGGQGGDGGDGNQGGNGYAGTTGTAAVSNKLYTATKSEGAKTASIKVGNFTYSSQELSNEDLAKDWYYITGGAEAGAGTAGGNAGNGGAGGDGGKGGKGGQGGAAGNGGNGGDATATGMTFSSADDLTITGNSFTVTATAGNGGAGGIGGAGGTGGVGGKGGDGKDGGTGGAGGDGGASAEKYEMTQITGKQEFTRPSIDGDTSSSTLKITAQAGQYSTDSSYAQGAGGQGGDAGNGGNGGNGGKGGDGGDGGNGGNGGNGGSAKATALSVTNSNHVNIALHEIKAVANGGNGGHVGAGGAAGAIGTAGQGGAAGNAGTAGQGGTGSGTAQAGQAGNAGTAGTAGGAGTEESTAGKAGTAGTTAGKGGGATAKAVLMSGVTGQMTVNAITATATAGIGGDNTADTNGPVATAQAMNLDETKLTIDGGEGNLKVAATASHATAGSTARAITETDSDILYRVKGIMNVSAKADTGESTQGVNSATAMALSGGKTVIEAKGFVATADSQANGGADSRAYGIDVDDHHELTIHAGDEGVKVDAKSSVTGDSTPKGLGQAVGLSANGGDSAPAVVDITTTGRVLISAAQANGTMQGKAYGVELNNAIFQVEAQKGIGLGALNTEGNEEQALIANASTISLDTGEDEINFAGDVYLGNESTMTLKSSATVESTQEQNGQSIGALGLLESTLILQDNAKTLATDGVLGIGNGKIYFYDEENTKEKYIGIENHPEYTQDNFRTISVGGSMSVQGEDNALFVRTNSLAGDVGDRIVLNGDISKAEQSEGKAKIQITVFDEGMKTGYEGKKDGKGWIKATEEGAEDTFDGQALDHAVTIIGSQDGNGTVDYEGIAPAEAYDNGVWAYEYDVDVEKDQETGSAVFRKVATTKAEASSAQKTAADANTAAAAAAATFFGADETLHERLGDLRAMKDGETENGVWAKYVGGRLSADGIGRETKVKYNGVEVGYDRDLGNNWTIGVAGEYVDGDTTLTAGNGNVKTRAGALYGTWLGDQGHYLDIIAKVGKVDSDTSSWGGTILNKMDGDFDANAYSLAVEYGRTYDLSSDWFITPATRLSYVHMGSASYDVKAMNNTMHARNDSFDSFLLRAGANVGKKFSDRSSFYFKLAALYDFDGDVTTTLTADGRTNKYENDLGGFSLEYGLGFDFDFGHSSLYFDVERISGGDLDKDWGVNAGFRYQF